MRQYFPTGRQELLVTKLNLSGELGTPQIMKCIYQETMWTPGDLVREARVLCSVSQKLLGSKSTSILLVFSHTFYMNEGSQENREY